MKKGDIIKIIWKDAQTFIGDYSEMTEEEGNLQDVISVGILIKSSKKSIIFADYKFLAKDVDDEDHRYIHIIPRGMIEKIKILEVSK